MSDYKFKSKVKLQGGGNLPNETASTVVVLDANKDLVSSAVTLAELAAFGGDITTAQGDATQALADAATAQGAANAAQSDATQALADAATAQGAANAAQADATQALSDASAAQADATQALSDAAAAQATADAALPAASFTDAAVTGKLLGAGYLAAAGTVTIGDSLEVAIEKLDGNSAAAQAAADAAQADADTGIANAATAQAAADAAQADATQALADAADLVTLSGVAANATDLGTFTGSIIPDTSTIKAALQALETLVGGIADPMEYKGVYNATTDSPALANGTGNNGDVYYVSVAGSQDFGAGAISFEVSDKVIYNGALGIWEKWDMTDAVASVNGQTGVVVLTSSDIAEGTNLYFTEEAAQDAVGVILTDSNTIDFTYTDATPSITADVITQMSITSDASGIMLSGDEAAPGNVQYYGTDGAGTKGFYPIPAVGSAGDMQETAFNAANNQIAPADVTGFLFAAATVRSFKALVSVSIDATADLYEAFELVGINKNGTFDMAVSAVGDDSGIVFSITSAGQIQYTSTNVSGFVSDLMKFRSYTTSVA